MKVIYFFATHKGGSKFTHRPKVLYPRSLTKEN